MPPKSKVGQPKAGAIPQARPRQGVRPKAIATTRPGPGKHEKQPARKESGTSANGSGKSAMDVAPSLSHISPVAKSVPTSKPIHVQQRMLDPIFIMNSIVYYGHKLTEKWHYYKDIRAQFEQKGQTVKHIMFPISSDDLNISDRTFSAGAVLTFSSQSGKFCSKG